MDPRPLFEADVSAARRSAWRSLGDVLAQDAAAPNPDADARREERSLAPSVTSAAADFGMGGEAWATPVGDDAAERAGGDAVPRPAFGARPAIAATGAGAPAQISEPVAGALAAGRRAQTQLSGAAEVSGRLAASIAQLARLWEQQVRHTQEDLGRLALLIAEQVLLVELPARQAFAMRMAHHAIALLEAAPQLRIRLSPADAAHLRAAQPELWARPTVTWVEDASLGLGGLVAEGGRSRVDASIAERLRAMAQALQLTPPHVAPDHMAIET